MNTYELKNAAAGFGADLVGIASIERFSNLAPENNPLSIFPQGRFMIVIGKRILRGIMQSNSNGMDLSGSFKTYGFYTLEDVFLSKITYDLTLWVETRGGEAVPLFGYDAKAAEILPLAVPVAAGKPAPNVYVDYQLAAQKCGLGVIGRHGLFLTPEFGPAQRFAMLITDLDGLESDPESTWNPCKDCSVCIESCPLSALNIDGSRDNRLCSRCPSGIIQTDWSRFNTIDRIGAACGRECYNFLMKRKNVHE